MEIISWKYALMAILSVLVYYLLNHKYRVGFLVLISCGFIASFSYILLIYVVAYALVNYFFGFKIPTFRYKKALFRTGVIINLAQLILLRYASFAIDPVVALFHGNLYVSKLMSIIIPIGISYFTLQGIGYLINVKMGWEKPENNFLNFLLYITFYPKFLSGPIERSNHFLPQLKTVRSFDQQQVVDGLRIALFGFFKKVAIANQLVPFITNTYSNLNDTDGSILWMLILIQPLYLYFDFSGYTDIAIGFSKMFGLELLPNFNRPFFSENMTNFWKRFHISLSSWFNDYIFKQTSFRRRKWGIYASVYALLITWLLFGIWHGAGWNFMMLGIVQALAIIYEFFTKKWRALLFSKLPQSATIVLGRTFTFIFYGASLTFFFSPDIKATFLVFSKLFILDTSLYYVFSAVVKGIPLSAIFLIIIFMFFELYQNDFGTALKKLENIWYGNRNTSRLLRWIVYSLILTVLFVLGSEVQQFIYAQF